MTHLVSLQGPCEWPQRRLHLRGHSGEKELGSNTPAYLWPGRQVTAPTALIQSGPRPCGLKQEEDISSAPADTREPAYQGRHMTVTQ